MVAQQNGAPCTAWSAPRFVCSAPLRFFCLSPLPVCCVNKIPLSLFQDYSVRSGHLAGVFSALPIRILPSITSPPSIQIDGGTLLSVAYHGLGKHSAYNEVPAHPSRLRDEAYIKDISEDTDRRQCRPLRHTIPRFTLTSTISSVRTEPRVYEITKEASTARR